MYPLSFIYMINIKENHPELYRRNRKMVYRLVSLGIEYNQLGVLQNSYIPVIYFAITDVRKGRKILKELTKCEYIHEHRLCI